MFNLTTRFQNAANQALTTTIVISGLVILLTFIQLYHDNVWNLDSTSLDNIKPSASIKHSHNYGSVNRKPKENSKVQFDLDADLTPLFNWNTKQVFAYVTAEYPGKTPGSSNKVTYWDSIIVYKEDAKIHLTNQRSKYSVWDVENSFREREAILKLEWNIQPYIGPLIFGETSSSTNFTFAESPNKKKSEAV
ncbi:microsomal signal peptidase subunit 3 [Scheffersomyces coipomensis]|uniref:microsomal signal peptidase subunit 3 n=1 Tax=Scheffersomyces coipomensis TaxID=1788519 RepID=UPI00315E00B0